MIKRRIHKDLVTASKLFERGYRVYHTKKVQSIAIHPTTDDNLFSVIRATALLSQKTDRSHRTFIVVYKTTRGTYYATCTCTTGGGSLNHIATLLLAIDAHKRRLPTHSPSCTSLPSKWNVPKDIKERQDILIPQLHIKKPSHLKLKNTGLSSPHTYMYQPTSNY